MKIVFFNKTLISGGIEKCIEILSKSIYKDYEIEVVYTDEDILDMNIVNILKKYAKVYKVDFDKEITCDICVWCYLYFDYEKLKKVIKAKKYITWIHSMPRILPDCLLDNQKYIDENDHIVCVSKAVENHLGINKESLVIHNFIDNDIKFMAEQVNPFENTDEKTLKLSVVSRLSSGKGFERLLIMCKELKLKKVPFSLLIVGKGRKKEQEVKDMFKSFDEVEFVGYKENPYPYIKNADYLVQLSDDESWCNSITEAKILQTPVIVTDFESSKEQITNLANGIVINLQEKNYDQYIDLIVNNKKLLRKNLENFKYENEIKEWKNLFKI